MNVMHAFMLILSIAGQPDKALAICDSYKKCADEELLIAAKLPKDFSYRIIAVMIIPEAPIT